MQEPIGKQNIHVVNDANDSNAPDIRVNEVSPHENTIHTAQSKNPSTYNAPVPNYLVPCPFLVQSFKETLQYCDEWRKLTSVSQSVIV